MTTKDYLGMLRNIDRRIKHKMEQAQQYRDIAENMGGMNFDIERVQRSKKNDMMAQAVVAALDKEHEASELVLKLTNLKIQILGQLDEMENDEYYNLLTGYYIDNLSFSKLAERENRSYKNVKRHFERAIECFEREYGTTYL